MKQLTILYVSDQTDYDGKTFEEKMLLDIQKHPCVVSVVRTEVEQLL